MEDILELLKLEAIRLCVYLAILKVAKVIVKVRQAKVAAKSCDKIFGCLSPLKFFLPLSQ